MYFCNNRNGIPLPFKQKQRMCSTDFEEIIIPKAVSRGPTDILKVRMSNIDNKIC